MSALSAVIHFNWRGGLETFLLFWFDIPRPCKSRGIIILSISISKVFLYSKSRIGWGAAEHACIVNRKHGGGTSRGIQHAGYL